MTETNVKRIDWKKKYINAEFEVINLRDALAASQTRNVELHSDLQEALSKIKDLERAFIKSDKDISRMSDKLICIKTALAHTTKALDLLNAGDEHRG